MEPTQKATGSDDQQLVDKQQIQAKVSESSEKVMQKEDAALNVSHGSSIFDLPCEDEENCKMETDPVKPRKRVKSLEKPANKDQKKKK